MRIFYKPFKISNATIMNSKVGTFYTDKQSVYTATKIFGIVSVFYGCRFSGSFGIFLLTYILVMLSMFSIVLMVGGVAPDTKTASVIASILYFPMLIFSGATLPYEVMPSALQKAADILPLTQGIKLLKASSLGLPIESVWIPIVIMFSFMVICGGIAIRFFKWES